METAYHAVSIIEITTMRKVPKTEAREKMAILLFARIITPKMSSAAKKHPILQVSSLLVLDIVPHNWLDKILLIEEP